MPPLDTSIYSISVYADRARLTRRGATTLPPGVQTVTIGPLPRSLLNDSVRASGHGNARLLGVQVITSYTSEIPEGEAKALEDEVQRLQDTDRVLADEEAAWQSRLAVVKGIGEQGSDDVARSVARGRLSLQQTTEWLDYLSQSMEAGQSVLRDLLLKRRELARQIEAARQRAAQLKSGAQREWREAQVELDVLAGEVEGAGEVKGAGEVDLASEVGVEVELTYSTYGASWTPLYDVRLSDHTIDLTYLAQVRQSTGEDWPFDSAHGKPATELILSTARPADDLEKPELDPWRIDLYRPPQPMQRAVASQPLAMAMPAAAPPPMGAAAMKAEMATVVAEGPSVTYRVEHPRPIPSDNAPHQVTVAALKVDAALDYVSVPKLVEKAYLRAKFKNDSPYVMLPGRVSLFHAADFVGTRALETIAPQEEVELFLGADERIKVEREEVERSVDKNFLGNTGRAQLGYRITVSTMAQHRDVPQNLLSENAHVTVLDQIPVSQHPDVKVKLREMTPKPNEQTEQGELKWEFDLKPQAKYEITFMFTVEYPKEQRVVGM